MKYLASLIVLLALRSTMATGTARTGELEPRRLENVTKLAFDHYVALTQARNDAELKRDTNLLWVDGLPEGPRAEAYAALKSGEVKMQKLETLDNQKSIPCPGGMIHHWIGLVFIPGAKLGEVLSVLEDYDKHSVYFAPDVERSGIESRSGDHFQVFLRFRRHKVITVVLDTEHAVDYFHDAPGKAHSQSSAVRIAEVENAGKGDEHEKTPGDDGGFLWRMETWWRMQEGDGGVYVQSEVASLTRDIPAGFGWLIKPFITSIPRETLKFTLEAARKAVEGRAVKSRKDLRTRGFTPQNASRVLLCIDLLKQVPDLRRIAIPSPFERRFCGGFPYAASQFLLFEKHSKELGECLCVVRVLQHESIRAVVKQKRDSRKGRRNYR